MSRRIERWLLYPVLAVMAMGMVLTTYGADDLLNPMSEREADFEQRMAWFNEARFGMFIHWGAYSVLGGEWQGKTVKGYAEWIRGRANISKNDYRKVAEQFQPDQFDADTWIRTARDAGMKYFVITTKHHDGFCLWDSAYTDYDIKDVSGLDVDPLAELSKACKKYGVRFGTYYSIMDWEYPTTNPSLMKEPGFKERYVQYMKDQVRELIEKYDTDILWFDGDWEHWWTLEDGADLYAYIRNLKPDIIINNRVSKRATFKRDFGTPENNTPGEDLGHDWEACWTINHSWGFKKADTNWTSTEQLIRKLVDITSKGGNLLLNVGPKADGTFPEACTERLLAMGQWLTTNGEGIYGTDSSEVPQPSWGRLTQKDNTLFLHLFDWPANGKLVFENVGTPASRASLLGATDQALPMKQEAGKVEITLPGQESVGLVPTIRLEFDGKIRAIGVVDTLGLKEGDLHLPAQDAAVSGEGPLRLERAKKNLGYWLSNDNRATWEFENVSPNVTYEVELIYSLDPAYAGAEFLLTCGDSECSGTVPATKGWGDYRTLKAGEIVARDVGRVELSLVKQGSGRALFNLQGIVLRRK